jgi:hypothetical protein
MIQFEWDERKDKANERKHGIDFETARQVFDDPLCVTFVERVMGGEQRWHAIGMAENLIMLIVAHTYRSEPGGEVIRIISARPASSHERRLYAEAVG